MSEIDYMNECTARDLIVMLSEEYQIAPSEAMDILYNSETYSSTDPCKPTACGGFSCFPPSDTPLFAFSVNLRGIIYEY